jgi:CobQ-like glutamine amidotransferase family enzyme
MKLVASVRKELEARSGRRIAGKGNWRHDETEGLANDEAVGTFASVCPPKSLFFNIRAAIFLVARGAARRASV